MKFSPTLTALLFLLTSLCVMPNVASATTTKSITTTVYAVTAQGLGDPIGTITLRDSKRGLVLIPVLSKLTPGDHGIHVHENADCSPKETDGKMVAAGAAGGHYDPDKTGHHRGPFGLGHKGDLPVLTVDAGGHAKKSFIAPRLELADVIGHALVIHEGGDNYADEPKPLGGGGVRIACAVVLQ